MSNWTDGYVADINYTYGYFHELNPNRARLALLLAGVRAPAFEHACELGFGQGLSINIHAAGSGVQWHGTDFLPAQAGFAQEVASVSGADVTLSDASFAEFCSRQDLPDFDFIALHGIWSWISEANRSLITDFVRRKLKVGGVVYVSYNTQPGWAAMAPLRDLMHDYAKTMTAPGVGVSSQVEASLAFVDELMATQPGYLRANPMVAGYVNDLKSKSRQYLAHEYFNQNWQPMPFARTAALLAAAKLDFACSADLLTHIDALQLTPVQQALLNKIPDPQLRQTVRDFCVNQQFRKDYWVKGSRPLSPAERMEALGEQQFILVFPSDTVPNTTTTPLGGARLQ